MPPSPFAKKRFFVVACVVNQNPNTRGKRKRTWRDSHPKRRKASKKR